jgi:hypothetical protein
MKKPNYFAEQYQLHSYAYFAGSQSYNEQMYPFNEYGNTGVMIDRDRDLDRMQNHQRDGSEFKEFKEFMKRKLRKRIKMKKRKDVFTPAPAYSNMYGQVGSEGIFAYPSGYYGGYIGENPNTTTNSYNNTYQMASLFEEMVKKA